MVSYIKNNLIAGFKTSPLQKSKWSLCLLLLFASLAFLIGDKGHLFEIKMLDSHLIYILPLSLFIFPSLLEEMFFRGILIPNNTGDKGVGSIVITSLSSAFFFTLWHPLNAVTINTAARVVFLDPYFLSIVFILGLICSLTYIFSKSIWTPIIIHWVTVLVWVLFLGGRNLVLE